jgi:hypothetical protein
VRYWQLRLNRFGAELTVDGDYGDLTAAAVAAAVPGSSGDQIQAVEAETIHAVVVDHRHYLRNSGRVQPAAAVVGDHPLEHAHYLSNTGAVRR